MSQTRIMRDRGGRFEKVEGFACAECGVWGPYGEFHPGLFCRLHKAGWTRAQIIEEIRWCAENLGFIREAGGE